MCKETIWKVVLLFLFSFNYFNTAYAKADPIIGKRTITFVNQCPFPVWYGVISGATPSRAGDVPCVTDDDCYSGSVCIDRGAAPKHCFWKNPIPANGQFQLTANGGTNALDFPIYQDALPSSWSGAGTGRTNCTAAGCETGDCGGGINGCPPGRGFQQPTTLAEWTFGKIGSDFYDVSVVNGMNIPIEMGPTLTPGERATLCSKNKYAGCGDPYFCGNPGAFNPITQVGVCTWDLVPPSNDYVWVAKGGAVCTTDASCPAGQACGLSYDPTKTPKFSKTCGKRLGHWIANEVCGKDKTFGAPFNCSQPLPPPNQAFSMFNLYGCFPIDSCYKTGATTGCCGCANWDKVGVSVPAAPYTEQCKNINPFWVENVQAGLRWLKLACPTVYTYPFDDMSSTFVCKVPDSNGNNMTNYTIVFCPGGKTGKVTGVAANKPNMTFIK